MPIIESEWEPFEKNADEPYVKACVNVAREALRLLDENPGDFECHKLICDAEAAAGEEGITGNMAAIVAMAITHCHTRGDEFRKKWNIENQIGTEGEKANEVPG